MDEEEIQMNYQELFDFAKYDVMEAKFNTMTTLQSKSYSSDTYIPEENFNVKNEKGVDEIKEIQLNQFIRWKYNNNENLRENILDTTLGIKNLTNKAISSNAKIVEWSDGSHQLIIGDQHYDILFSEMDNVRFGVRDKSIVVVNKPTRKRLILTPSEFSTGNKKLERVVDTQETSQKTKLAYNFYDKQIYRKEDFSSMFGRKKNNDPKKVIANRKRKRSNLSDKN